MSEFYSDRLPRAACKSIVFLFFTSEYYSDIGSAESAGIGSLLAAIPREQASVYYVQILFEHDAI